MDVLFTYLAGLFAARQEPAQASNDNVTEADPQQQTQFHATAASLIDHLRETLEKVPSLVEVRNILGRDAADQVIKAWSENLLHLYGSHGEDVLAFSAVEVFVALEVARRAVLAQIGSTKALALISCERSIATTEHRKS